MRRTMLESERYRAYKAWRKARKGVERAEMRLRDALRAESDAKYLYEGFALGRTPPAPS